MTDQPLYKVAEKLKCKFPDEQFSGNFLYLSLGRLHIYATTMFVPLKS